MSKIYDTGWRIVVPDDATAKSINEAIERELKILGFDPIFCSTQQYKPKEEKQ